MLLGDDTTALAASPQLEGFRARGVEVLPADRSRSMRSGPSRLDAFDGHKLRSVTQAGDELDKLPLQGETAGMRRRRLAPDRSF